MTLGSGRRGATGPKVARWEGWAAARIAGQGAARGVGLIAGYEVARANAGKDRRWVSFMAA